MKYAIIENEAFARMSLQSIMKKLRPSYECAFEGETVAESVAYFSTHHDVDFVFMDVALGDGDCFNIFHQIDLKLPIIFTTAYDEYAVRAFKVNSIDSLLKPILEEDVAFAMNKLEGQLGKQRDYHDLVNNLQQGSRGRLLIGTSAGYLLIKTEDVAWLEAEDKIIQLVLKKGRKVITDFPSLGDALDKLDPNVFFQLSRSVVASVDSIVRVSKFFKGRLSVELKAQDLARTEIVSSQRRQDLLDWLGY